MAIATYSAASPIAYPAALPSSRPTIGIPASKAAKRRLMRSRSREDTPRTPSAAETASVSRPSGSTKSSSFTART